MCLNAIFKMNYELKHKSFDLKVVQAHEMIFEDKICGIFTKSSAALNSFEGYASRSNLEMNYKDLLLTLSSLRNSKVTLSKCSVSATYVFVSEELCDSITFKNCTWNISIILSTCND